ncbi:RagB/SusD family nutrient uptake outer membrane protein [Pedobacter yulinensis]|uniref:RagB/SusD family nutrient uptake outer membrane protein n=1 Tax=Pedobacter yulinensis TaxID=2126353 RepID=A0A2T3HJV0_9SPHI|nr:RagB/SusD family nutrient uptake outer membrane protein [Pedobacter yulinensis]PST82714.1 RagB/SusD family nutrient uptake outer membrane protein [Pedobacter yulinensis]
MKNLTRITYMGLVALALTSASCKKALDEDPRYSINSKTAFETESTANLALAGCYGYMTTYNAYGQGVPEIMVGGSGLGWAQTNGQDQDMFASLNVPATNGTVSMIWSGWYKVIGECNYFISSLEQSQLGTAYKKQAIAEAKFLRALCYFNLANVFGGVPLRLEPTTSASIAKGRATRQEVYAQVEKDWLEAAENLATKEQLGAAAAGKATKYAAFAYLAKLYWMLGSQENVSTSPYWAKAKQMGDRVIEQGNYALAPKFGSLFANSVSNSPESIFQLNFSSVSTYVGNRGNWLFAPSNTTTGISWGRVKVSKAFYDQFRGTYPDDPRLKLSIAATYVQSKTNNFRMFSYPYLSGPGGVNATAIDSVRYAALADPTNPKVDEISPAMKAAYVDRNGDHQGWPYFIKAMDVNSTAQNSNKHAMIFRYADFLLLMAEVENELNNNAKAREYMNLVLTRARNSGTTPSVYPKNLTAAVPQNELRTLIFNERLFELAGEYEMYVDVRRRGVDYLKLVVDRHNNHHLTKAFVASAAASNNNTPFRERMLPNSPELLRKNLLLPIPQNELNTNEGLSADQQNYGY